MTSKNLSTIIEKTILISSSGTVSRLRSVICILIFSIFTLLGLNNCFAQAFIPIVQPGFYDNLDNFTNLRSNQAIISYKYTPLGVVDDLSVLTYDQIVVSGFDFTQYLTAGYYGRYFRDNTDSSIKVIGIIDPDNYYFSANNARIPILLSKLQNELELNKLGTVQQRRDYISFLSSSFDVNPVNFVAHLGPWLLVGLSIALAIPPMWWILKRFLR